jgi:hypothetical protein
MKIPPEAFLDFVALSNRIMDWLESGEEEPPPPPIEYWTNKVAGLNVRRNPSLTGYITGKLMQGEVVPVLELRIGMEEKYEWARIADERWVAFRNLSTNYHFLERT